MKTKNPMKANKYFDLEELVPKEIYESLSKEKCLKLLNPKALLMLDNIREILDIPLICNNWNKGGNRNYCGYRQPDCPIGAKSSQHKLGNAFDLISNKMTAKEMREKLEENKDRLIYSIRVEKWNGDDEITWLHVDTKSFKGDKIYFFKA